MHPVMAQNLKLEQQRYLLRVFKLMKTLELLHLHQFRQLEIEMTAHLLSSLMGLIPRRSIHHDAVWLIHYDFRPVLSNGWMVWYYVIDCCICLPCVCFGS